MWAYSKFKNNTIWNGMEGYGMGNLLNEASSGFVDKRYPLYKIGA